MDHLYIERERVPEHYVAGDLPVALREAFEAHLVDCAECSDRLLLAEMFHARNGHSPASRAKESLPIHARLAARFRPWQFVLILGIAAAILLAVSTIIYLWELGRL